VEARRAAVTEEPEESLESVMLIDSPRRGARTRARTRDSSPLYSTLNNP
jgi:hypothetical protein